MVSFHIISSMHGVVVPDQSSERFTWGSCKHGRGQPDLVKGEQAYILAEGMSVGFKGYVQWSSTAVHTRCETVLFMQIGGKKKQFYGLYDDDDDDDDTAE